MSSELTRREKRLLFWCVFASLLFHVAGLAFLRTISLSFGAPLSNMIALAKQEKDDVLREAFASIQGDVGVMKEGSDLMPQEEPSLRLHSPKASPIPMKATLIQEPISTKPLRLAFSPKIHRDLFDHLSKELAAPSKERSQEKEKARLMPAPCATPSGELKALGPAKEVDLGHAEVKLEPSASPFAKRKALPALTSPTLTLPRMPRLPTLGDLATTSCSDSFEIDLAFVPLEKEEGYLFALTLIPCENLNLPKMKQNYLFLVDKGNSIQEMRLNATKQAIYKAIEELPQEDTFNLFVFDNKIEKFSPEPLLPCPESLAKAKVFLEEIKLGSFFSQSDLSLPLFLTVPSQVKDDEIYTALLFTDGESLKKKEKARALFREWNWRSEGKISLYTVGMTSDSTLATLDAASVLSKGSLSSYSGKRGLKRRLLKLMKSIRTPVAKQISCHAVSLSKENTVLLLPGRTRAPHFYLDQPYVIFGTTKSLDDFVLFVQGRFKDRWLNIKKRISFVSAKRGGASLKTAWALQQAYGYYELYLQEGHLEHLAEAKSLLTPYHIPVAFE